MEKQTQTNFRTTPSMRKRLGEAAAERGVSVNQEINERLKMSFGLSDLRDPLFGSDALYQALKLVAVVMESAGRSAAMLPGAGRGNADNWFNDPFAFEHARQAALQVLDRLQPAGDIAVLQPGDLPQLPLNEMFANYGRQIAQGLMRQVASGEVVILREAKALQDLRAALGTELVERVKANFMGASK